MMEYGTLYIVATPIGNMGDITLRALEILKKVDVVAAEDTRHTQKLLNHYEIKVKTISFHEYSDEKRRNVLTDLLREGKNIALVSDAGTPIISDPGYVLVRDCIALGIKVESLPGACAAVMAITLSGMDCASYVFAGFLEAKQTARKAQLQKLAGAELPVVLYESPNRVLKTLTDVCEVYGEDIVVCAAREMTKVYEEVLRGSAVEVLQLLSQKEVVKGEFVLLIDALSKQVDVTDDTIIAALKKALADGYTKKDAVTLVTASLSCPKNRVYKLLLVAISI